jgi:uncharacterized membrane protein YccF (DUF307 family)
MTETRRRKCLHIVDAIVAGEGEGPMEPEARPLGMLIGGINPVAVDAVLATIIRFNYKNIPIIAKAFDITDWPLVDFGADQIETKSPSPHWKSLGVGILNSKFCFKPPSGWLGHVELKEALHQ